MTARRTLYIFLLIQCCLISEALQAQHWGTVRGHITNVDKEPLVSAIVAAIGTAYGTHTDAKGYFELKLPSDSTYTIAITTIGYVAQKHKVTLRPLEIITLDRTLQKQEYSIAEVIKKDDRQRYELGAIYLDPQKAHLLPSTVGGIEGLIKTFVGGNNEMTSQYAVRGGNFDENLVYINDFEVYRPFLVRSGQQEGLSVINPDLVGQINFSLGGFSARYGDKMSSVLDINYKRPKRFVGSVNASLLGAGIHLEGLSKNEKLSVLFGARQKSNQYLLQSQPTTGVYNPSFTDVQFLANYKFNPQWETEILANYARNRFTFYPERHLATFGLFDKAYQLDITYKGHEIDQFDASFIGWSATYRPSQNTKLKLLASHYLTNERETYDFNGEYLLGQLETSLGRSGFGQIKAALGTGFIQNHARNYLDIHVSQLAHKGSSILNNHVLLWGAEAQRLLVNDQLNEWERRDSGGFTQPYDPTQINMYKYYNTKAQLENFRYNAYLQDNWRVHDSIDLTISAGARVTYSTLNNELIISPRLQLAYRPKWESDVIFKVAAGMYAQPPLYREMRNLNGDINTGLKAQKSLHYAAGMDYSFIAGNLPFKITAEAYYKQLWDLVPYEYDNVRLRYFGDNLAKGYAYGGEIRLYGDFLPDAPSWLSIGLLNTKEDIINDQIVYQSVSGTDSAIVYPGYIPRPSDQRFMASLFLQDYLPGNKNFRVHLNLMYSSGLPFGVPDQQRYGDTLRLPDYKRVDIGFSALLFDKESKVAMSNSSLFKHLHSAWISLEVFNLLGIQNTLSYTWIQDQTTGNTYAVPNRLTNRLLNLKLQVKF